MKYFVWVAGGIAVLALVALLCFNIWAKKTVDEIKWLGGP